MIRCSICSNRVVAKRSSPTSRPSSTRCGREEGPERHRDQGRLQRRQQVQTGPGSARHRQAAARVRDRAVTVLGFASRRHPFGDHLAANSDAAAEALLAITDEHAASAKAPLAKAYNALRGKAKENVADALPASVRLSRRTPEAAKAKCR